MANNVSDSLQIPRPTAIVIIGFLAYIFFFSDRKPTPPSPDPPVPVVPSDPTDPAEPLPPATSDAPQELLQLVATCRVLASALDAGEFTDTAQVHEAWVCVDRHALAGESLSSAAKAWASAAERKVQAAIGQTGATEAAVMTPELAGRASQAFRQLADELEAAGKF